MADLSLTIVGNLTRDPELCYTASGAAVCRLDVAHNPRVRKGDEWVDGEPTFLTVNAWRTLGENCAESLGKGARVIVSGRLRTERWEDDKGEKRSRLVLDADAIGPELAYATATVRKMTRVGQAPPDDPWATGTASRPAEEEAPF